MLAEFFVLAEIFLPAANFVLAEIFVPAANFVLAGNFVPYLFLFVLDALRPQVNNYGHGETDSSPNHIFPREA